jgi:hypothetical protein
MECSHCLQMFLTTEFYDHMRELNRSGGGGGEMRQSENAASGKNEGGRITEEFTLCYEDGEKSYQSHDSSC